MPERMPEQQCNICNATDERFVRDHNHWTGRIRGILCEVCNSWLSVYESNIRRAAVGKPTRGHGKYLKWVEQFHDKIEAHLASDTGIYYKKREKRAKTLCKLAARPPSSGLAEGQG